MRQLDYIKIKIENIEELNTQYLIEHPTIKNRYKLKNISFSNGPKLFGNNIDIYYNHQTVYISTSIPYLIHGHNFVEVDSHDAYKVFECLSETLKIDIFSGRVIDFEVAFLFDSRLPFKNLIKAISGVDGLELQKKSSSFLAYGKDNIQIKIYNVYNNLKGKVPKSIFDSIIGLNKASLKIELKTSKSKEYTVKQFLEFGVSTSYDILENIIEHNIHCPQFNYEGSKFDDILYKALLQTNQYTDKSVNEMVLDIIDSLPISYSQKTARRKSLRAKQLKSQISEYSNLTSLLGPCCRDITF